MSQHDGQDGSGKTNGPTIGRGTTLHPGVQAASGRLEETDNFEMRANHADMQAHIGRQLRAVYTEIVEEPVPDRLLQVLEKLAALERPQNGGL
jgi:hypothetical protein